MEDLKEKILKCNLTVEQYEEILEGIMDSKDKNISINWKKLKNKYNIPLNEDSIRKANDSIFGGYFVNKYLTEKFQNINISEDEIIKQMNDKKKELEILKIQIQDEKRVNNKYMRPLARHQRMLDVIKDEMKNLKPLEFNVSNKTNNIGGKEASLLISDLHYGIKCNNYWNKYDINIANERMFKLINDTILYCKTFNVSTLNVELLGDLISGIIHKTIELENEIDVVQQTLKVSELLSTCINKLADNIPEVKIFMTVGNHSRINPDKKESVDKENFEYLIWDYLKLRCIRDDVTFLENDIDETLIHYTINGEEVFGVHGHLDRFNSISSNFSKMFKKPIKSIHMGHLHHTALNEDSDIQVIMNSTISGVDTHSKNLRFIGKPSQTLLIYDRENTININIKLD